MNLNVSQLSCFDLKRRKEKIRNFNAMLNKKTRGRYFFVPQKRVKQLREMFCFLIYKYRFQETR